MCANLPPECVCPASFLLAQNWSVEPWAHEKCYSLHRACCARQIFFPCFDTHLLLGICSPWQTWTYNAFDFSLGPSYKSFQQCYGIPTDLKVYIGKVCISALLQNSECVFFFYLFLPVCFNCCCCLIVTFMQAIAPPPVQSWALVWINRANQKVLLKVTFFLYETECRECELLFLSLDFFLPMCYNRNFRNTKYAFTGTCSHGCGVFLLV